MDDLLEIFWAARRGEAGPPDLVARERARGDLERVAGALAIQGYRYQGGAESTLRVLGEATEIFESLGETSAPQLWAVAWNITGVVLDDLGRLEQAADAFARSSEVAEGCGWMLGVGFAQMNLATTDTKLRNFAAVNSRAWWMLSHPSGDPALLAHAALAEGYLYWYLGLPSRYSARLLLAERYSRWVPQISRAYFQIGALGAYRSVGDIAGCDQIMAQWPYPELSDEVPYGTDFQLEQIELLTLKNRFDEARVALDGIDWSHESGLRGGFNDPSLARTRLYRALGDPAAALGALRPIPDHEQPSLVEARRLELDLLVELELWEEATQSCRSLLDRMRGWREQLAAADLFETIPVAKIHRGMTQVGPGPRHLLESVQQELAVVSHELRNALAPIVIMADQVGEERFQNAVERAIDAAQLLGDGIAVDRSEWVQTRLDAVVASVTEEFRGIADAKHVELRTDLFALDLLTDATTLEMVLRNLVSNAIKYTPPDTVVEIGMHEDPDGPVNVLIRDQGAGFSPEDLEQAFTPGQTLSARPTAGESSTGIGLYISSEMLRRLDGKIVLANRPHEEGAAVAMVLEPIAAPSERSESTSTRLSPPTEPTSRQTSRPVLVVEDNPLMVEYLAEALAQHERDHLAVDSIEQLDAILESIPTPQFEFAMCDIHLHGVNSGIQIAQTLRARYPDMVVAITSSLRREAVAQYEDLQGLIFLQKPFGHDALSKLVDGVSRNDLSALPSVADSHIELDQRVAVQFQERLRDARSHDDPDAATSTLREAIDFAELYEYRDGIETGLKLLTEDAKSHNFSEYVAVLTELGTHPLVSGPEASKAFETLGWEYRDRAAPARAHAMFEIAQRFSDRPELAEALAQYDDAREGADYALTEREVRQEEAAAIAESDGDYKRAFELLDRLRSETQQHLIDLVDIFQLASERVTLQARSQMLNELDAVNQQLFRQLAEHSSHVRDFVSSFTETLPDLRRCADSDTAKVLIQRLVALCEEFDEFAHRPITTETTLAIPTVAAYLTRSMNRITARNRILLIWDNEADDAPLEVSKIAAVQAELLSILKAAKPGSIVTATIDHPLPNSAATLRGAVS